MIDSYYGTGFRNTESQERNFLKKAHFLIDKNDFREYA